MHLFPSMLGQSLPAATDVYSTVITAISPYILPGLGAAAALSALLWSFSLLIRRKRI